jgi:hypothetical protein
MIVFLTNYEYLTTGVQLANSSDVLANSLSLIEGDKIVNLKEVIETIAGTAAGPPLNWLTGDSTGKNTISTGEGLLS